MTKMVSHFDHAGSWLLVGSEFLDNSGYQGSGSPEWGSVCPHLEEQPLRAVPLFPRKGHGRQPEPQAAI